MGRLRELIKGGLGWHPSPIEAPGAYVYHVYGYLPQDLTRLCEPTLLYVGKSRSPMGRTESHLEEVMTANKWGKNTVLKAIHFYPYKTEEAALAAEKLDIEICRPLFNIVFSLPEAGLFAFKDSIRKELLEEIGRYKPLPYEKGQKRVGAQYDKR